MSANSAKANPVAMAPSVLPAVRVVSMSVPTFVSSQVLMPWNHEMSWSSLRCSGDDSAHTMSS